MYIVWTQAQLFVIVFGQWWLAVRSTGWLCFVRIRHQFKSICLWKQFPKQEGKKNCTKQKKTIINQRFSFLSFSALWVSCVGLILIYTINFYTGMVLVAHYRNCDPIRSHEIAASDEILPLYIISELGHMKGITGFFVAGIFAASLG